MKVFVVHDEKGHIHSIAAVAAGAGKLGLHPPAGREVSVVEVLGLPTDMAGLALHARLRELARSHIVHADRKSLIRRSTS